MLKRNRATLCNIQTGLLSMSLYTLCISFVSYSDSEWPWVTLKVTNKYSLCRIKRCHIHFLHSCGTLHCNVTIFCISAVSEGFPVSNEMGTTCLCTDLNCTTSVQCETSKHKIYVEFDEMQSIYILRDRTTTKHTRIRSGKINSLQNVTLFHVC